MLGRASVEWFLVGFTKLEPVVFCLAKKSMLVGISSSWILRDVPDRSMNGFSESSYPAAIAAGEFDRSLNSAPQESSRAAVPVENVRHKASNASFSVLDGDLPDTIKEDWSEGILYVRSDSPIAFRLFI